MEAARMIRALCVGGAIGGLEEAHAALKMFEPDLVIACNDMIAAWPESPLHVAVTLHPKQMGGWLKKRAFDDKPETWTDDVVGKKIGNVPPGFSHVLPDWGGSSGLFMVQVALEKRASKIVLAGVPMTPKFGHFVRKEQWAAAFRHRNAWNNHLDQMLPFVRSMSGWTREQLGKPTIEWLTTE